MLTNLLTLLVIIALAAGLVWLIRVLWRRPNPLVKWGASGVLGVVALLVTLFAVLGALGLWTAYAPRGNEVLARTVTPTPELVARGEMFAASVCAGCHSPNESLPLTGGGNLFDEIPMPLGSAVPPNLTPAGRISGWTDGELQRAIREGTDPAGHLLPVMSSQTFRHLSQQDLDAIVAYLRSQEPQEGSEAEPKQQLTYLALMMVTLGMLPLKDAPESNVPPAPVPVGDTEAYGTYVGSVLDCVLCHGDTLDGGNSPILPNGPSLRAVSGWGAEAFIQALRTGVTPSGTEMDPKEMPWRSFGQFDDVTLAALYRYVISFD